MIDQSTDLLNLPLPHPNNRLDEDVVRLRAALALIDELLAGRAALGPDGKLLTSQLPNIAVTEYLGTVGSQASMLQLVGQKGDWCIRTDEARTWIITGDNPASIGSWTPLAYPSTSGVTSINSRTGVVTLTRADLGLANVDNTSDLSKPISTAVAAALAGKQAVITGAASSIVENLLTAGRVVISDGFGRVGVSTITADGLSHLSGLTGNIQAQLGLRVAKTSETGSAALPVGTTAQRDTVPVTGAIRFNSSTGQFEGNYGTSGSPVWRTIGDTVSLSSIADWPSAVSAAEVGYLDGVTSGIQSQLNGLSSSIASVNSALAGKQAADADLAAIAALTGSYGYLRKTAEGVWTIDAGGGGGGAGTVTSVGLTAPSLFNVAGSPVTTSGTLGLSLANQSANLVFAGPASGSAAAPGFRALAVADIPSLSSLYQIVNTGLTNIISLSSGTTKGLLWKNTTENAWSLQTTLTNAHITAINSVPIGASGTSSGAFSTLSASGTVSGAGFTALFASPLPIGSSTPNTGAFSTLSASGTVNFGSGHFIKDTSGRVGIGVTPGGWSGVNSLSLSDKGCSVYGAGAAQSGISQGAYYNGGWRFSSGNKASAIELLNGQISTYTTNYSGSDGVSAGFAQGPYVAPGGTTWTTGSSDARQKRDFAPVQGLATLRQIIPTAYRFLWDADTAPLRLGFTAQNLRPLIPEMVVEKQALAEDGTPLLTIIADYLLPVLVQAIKDLADDVDSLKATRH